MHGFWVVRQHHICGWLVWWIWLICRSSLKCIYGMDMVSSDLHDLVMVWLLFLVSWYSWLLLSSSFLCKLKVIFVVCYYCMAKFLDVKIMHAHMCSPFLSEIENNKSSYFSWITLYIENAMSQWYSFSIGFHCISSCLRDDAMMLPQHLICVSKYKEVLRLSESQCSWG